MEQYRERETGNIQSQNEVKKIHSNVSFSPVVDTYADLGWDLIVVVPRPQPSSDLKIMVEDAPVEINGEWTQVWIEADKFADSEDSTKEEKEAGHIAFLETEAEDETREDRDSRLAACDWHGLSDTVMSEEMTEYRQALRDVPGQAQFPHEVTWPDSP